MKAVGLNPPNAPPSEVPAFPPAPSAFGARRPDRPERGGSFLRLRPADARRRAVDPRLNPALLG